MPDVVATEPSEPPAPATVAERLRRARRQRFVGRAAELELVRSALETREPAFTVLFVHGPGGVGKSALLAIVEEEARAAGWRPLYLDLRAAEPSPPGFLAALTTALGLPPGSDPAEALGAGSRPLLLLDAFEAAIGLEDWLRERFIPALPAGALVVIAGRTPPADAWRRDPGWQDLLRVISLRNLDPDDARAYLRVAGVDERLHAHVVELTHGHPLALSLLVDVLGQRPGGEDADGLDLAAVPDVVARLVNGFLAGVPTPRHRRALEILAHSRFTTEDLLRAVLEGDATDLFDWLRMLSFVEAGPHGLLPHDLAREVVDAELRWRDPAGYEDLHRRIRRHVVRRIRTTRGREHARAVADLIFLHRSNPATRAFWDWESFGSVYADAARPEDREAILAMTERHEGGESAALAAYWLERQPEGFAVFRGREPEPLGFVAQLALHLASAEDLARDPAARAMRAYVERHGAVREGDEVVAGRFFIDADAYQAPSPCFNVVTMRSVEEWVGRPRLAWCLIPYADAAAGAGMMEYIDFHRAPEADYEVGGRRYAVFARDWRRGGVEAWLDLMEERELGAEPTETRRADGAAPLVALSKPEFAEAVRRALRDLHRPAALAANPLARSRLVAEGEQPGGAEALAAAVRDAVRALAVDPRDERLFRALDRTYVRPAATQEQAAELLGLPFSTYRGHLVRGIDRVVERLWERELYG